MKPEINIKLNSVELDNNEKLETVYRYAELGVLLLGVLCVVLLSWFIWAIVASNIPTEKLIIFGLCYMVMLSVCLRGLIQLWEKVVITKNGSKLITPFRIIEISWIDIKSVRL